jgi:hypothetical protein
MTVVSNKVVVSWNMTLSSLTDSTSASEKFTDSVLKMKVADFSKTLVSSTKICSITS